MVRSYVFLCLILGCFIFLSCGFISDQVTKKNDSFGDSPTPTPVINISSITKLTTSSAALVGPDPASNDCGKYLASWAGTYTTTSAGSWTAGSFIYNSKIRLLIPCKYGDAGGWNQIFADYDVSTGLGQWIDSRPASAGVNEVISRTDFDLNGVALQSNNRSRIVLDDQGKMYGILMRFLGGRWNHYPILGLTLASFSSLSFDPTALNLYEGNLQDNSFLGSMLGAYDVILHNNVFYVVAATTNTPTNDTHYISIFSSTDLTTLATQIQTPSAPILTGYTLPFVGYYNSNFHMIAFNVAQKRWEYFRAGSLINLSTATAIDLKLKDHFNPASGAWDSSYFSIDANNEPNIRAAEIYNGNFYLFYSAGNSGFAPGAPPYNAGRSYGVLKLPLQ